LKGTLDTAESVMDFYDRTMAITSFSGVGRLPEISAPILTVDGCPVGFSISAGHYQDEFLLTAAQAMFG
jgi:amidase